MSCTTACRSTQTRSLGLAVTFSVEDSVLQRPERYSQLASSVDAGYYPQFSGT